MLGQQALALLDLGTHQIDPVYGNQQHYSNPDTDRGRPREWPPAKAREPTDDNHSSVEEIEQRAEERHHHQGIKEERFLDLSLEQAAKPSCHAARGTGDAGQGMKRAERRGKPEIQPAQRDQPTGCQNGSPDQLGIPFSRNEWPPMEAKNAHRVLRIKSAVLHLGADQGA